MTTPNKSLREEFDRAFDDFYYEEGYKAELGSKDMALFGAKWMAERICLEADRLSYAGAKQMVENPQGIIRTFEIRQLAKELQ